MAAMRSGEVGPVARLPADWRLPGFFSEEKGFSESLLASEAHSQKSLEKAERAEREQRARVLVWRFGVFSGSALGLFLALTEALGFGVSSPSCP